MYVCMYVCMRVADYEEFCMLLHPRCTVAVPIVSSIAHRARVLNIV